MSSHAPVTPDSLTREPTDVSPTEFDDGPTPKQLACEARAATEHLFVDTVTPETDETVEITAPVPDGMVQWETRTAVDWF